MLLISPLIPLLLGLLLLSCVSCDCLLFLPMYCTMYSVLGHGQEQRSQLEVLVTCVRKTNKQTVILTCTAQKPFGHSQRYLQTHAGSFLQTDPAVCIQPWHRCHPRGHHRTLWPILPIPWAPLVPHPRRHPSLIALNQQKGWLPER